MIINIPDELIKEAIRFTGDTSYWLHLAEYVIIEYKKKHNMLSYMEEWEETK